MSITEIGRSGEIMARDILKNKFCVDGIFQPDWMILKNGKYYVIEVKHKEIFKPPPFYGHGLDIRQVKARMEFYEKTGIETLFLVIDFNGVIYWQWLKYLEASGDYFNTRNGVRIYNIQKFERAGRYEMKLMETPSGVFFDGRKGIKNV